jgi:phytoene dehydrogenase-like protein
MSAWDVIVIGGGHNGLVAGAYLARSGARVVVLEARSKTGGAATTDAPGRRHPRSR